MFLALRELKFAKLRYVLIASIMVLISWLVLFVSGLANGLSTDNASAIQNMNAEYIVLQEHSENRLNRSILTEETIQNVKGQEGSSTPLGMQMTTITKNGSVQKWDATFFAIDFTSKLTPKVVEGKSISNKSMNEVVADLSLKSEGVDLGDVIQEKMSGKEFEIVGFTEGQTFSHSPVIHMNLKEWEELIQTKNDAKASFNALILDTDEVTAQKIASEVSGIEVISKKEALNGIPGYKEEQGSLIMMIVFLFVIAAFVLAVFFYVMTIQKMNQYGVLKAIGAKSSYLARTIISQVMSISILSLSVSVSLSYGVAFILPKSIPFSLTPTLVIGCAVLFLAVSVIGSLLSLYRVVKVDAIEAIGRAA
ncbi:ABC transporter permease [Peribacillus alkalitolerans]|uniref:ABC transporter permease n=1 Tax=Peribacillus alkalitolerans TaxID=1550385 RepID=UPI0013D6DE90|nr:ABC transporter permease [Peribacillus alkalitolerans]